MLIDNIHTVIKDKLPVAFLSDKKDVWCRLEREATEYIPVHYAFYNIVYQKKYFEAVYEEYTDISVVIYGGGHLFAYGRYLIGKGTMCM